MKIIISALFVFFSFSAAGAQLLYMERFTLDNGMELIIIPNSRIDAVNHALVVKAGAADDKPAKSGIAHYLEHMMFKGSKNYEKGEYSKTVNSLGGNFNAYTSHDATVYWVNIASKYLEKIMQMESDRFANLKLDEKEFELEKEVILEERLATTENNPRNLFFEEMRLSLFKNHPYRMPVIGFGEEIRNINIDDMKEFYERYYKPSNATLIVTGNVEPEKVFKMANKYYGKLPQDGKVRRIWRAEPEHYAKKEISFEHPRVSQNILVKKFITPGFFENEEAALSLLILSEILGGSQTSYLYEKLVRERELASNVSVSYDGLNFGPGTFSFYVTANEGVSLKEIETELHKYMKELLSRKKLDKKAVERAKNLYKSSVIYSLEGLSGPAYLIANIIASGLEYDYINIFPAKIDEVEDESILKNARAMFYSNSNVTGYMRGYMQDKK